MVKIYKVDKDTLAVVKNILVETSNTTSMTISHFADCVKSTEATIPFTIEGSNLHVPYLEDVEFQIVTRQKVDFTGIGPNGESIKENVNDIGKYDYRDIVPRKPLDLPPGFREIYSGD